MSIDHKDQSCPESREAVARDALLILLDVVHRENIYTLQNNDNDPTTIDDYIADVVQCLERHLDGEVPLYDKGETVSPLD